MYASVDIRCCKCKNYKTGKCKGLLEWRRVDCRRRNFERGNIKRVNERTAR